MDEGLQLSNISMRKRKQPDMDVNVASAITTLTESMSSFKASIEASISAIQTNLQVNVISELNKLNVTTNDIKTDLNTLRSNYTELKQSIAVMNAAQLETTSKLDSVITTVEFTSDRVDKIDNRLTNSEDKLKLLDVLHTDFLTLKKTFQQKEQRDRINNIEVVGLPECKSEDLTDIIIRIAKLTDVSISSQDVHHAHRIQPRHSVPGRPRVVVAKLQQRIHKDNIIAGIRKKRGITTKDLNIIGEPKPIYVNEHLTGYNKELFKKCKETATVKQFQFVWIKNCRIFMRKHDKSPLFVINSEEDLKKFH